MNESLDLHILGAIIFTLLAHLHTRPRSKQEWRAHWVALISVCMMGLALIARDVML